MSEKKLGRNDPCWCGSQKKYKHCHMEMDEQIDRFRREGHTVPTRQMIKTPEQIEGIRQSSRINIAVLDLVAQKIHEGMTTEEIDKIVYEETTRLGGIPAPLNYEGFPKSVCTSVNNQVCHGIPSEKVVLRSGDIINVDVSTIYNGYFSDSSRMFCIGNVSTRYKDRDASLAIVAESLATMVRAHCGNYLAFFPSYAYMEQAYATAVVLLIMVLLINALSAFIAKKFTRS